jgi:thiol:disulfide interchange protein DsbD
VQQLLSHAALLQANVTANSKKDAELLRHLQVLGLPTILFFDADGQELPDLRVTGFMNADAFREHLQKLPR